MERVIDRQKAKYGSTQEIDPTDHCVCADHGQLCPSGWNTRQTSYKGQEKQVTPDEKTALTKNVLIALHCC